MRRRPWVPLVLLGIFSLVLVPSAPAVSANDEDALLNESDEIAAAAHFLHDDSGLSEAEMQHRISDEIKIDSVIEHMRTVAPDRFSGAWTPRSGTLDVTVRLTAGPAVEKIEELARASDPQIRVEYTGTLNEKELAEAASIVAEQYGTRNDGIDGVYVDSEAASLVVVANPDTRTDVLALFEASHFDASSGQISSRTNTLNAQDQVNIRVELTDSPASSANRGGVGLTSCTAGFTVGGSGMTGFVTAGHCGNTQKYATSPGGSPTYVAPFKQEHWSSTRDLQWHTTSSHSDYASFYGASASTATARTGTGSGYQGQSLCHRGKTTGYSCGYVQSTAYAPTWSGACNTTSCQAYFVRVDGLSLANLKGDSGGPWFSGGHAYGIHMGGLFGEVGAWSVYSKISYISIMNIGLL